MMWPFKTTQQRIEDLEDAIAEANARLSAITEAHCCATGISFYHLDKITDLKAKLAVLGNKLVRERRRVLTAR